MKLTVALLAIFLSGSSFYVYGEEETKAFKWKPIYGMKVKGAHIYYDTNSLVDNQDQENKYSAGILLAIFDEPKKLETDNGTRIGNSMTTYAIIDCKTGLSAPLVDIYYEAKTPTRSTAPVAIRNYEMNEETVRLLPKNSPIYLTLCPTKV